MIAGAMNRRTHWHNVLMHLAVISGANLHSGNEVAHSDCEHTLQSLTDSVVFQEGAHCLPVQQEHAHTF